MANTVLVINTRIEKSKKTNQHLEKTLKTLSHNTDIKTVHYEQINRQLIKKMKPSRMILSGQNTPFRYYSSEKLNRFFGTIKSINAPILGICGGHQLLALCYGGIVAPIKVVDATLKNYDGCWREKGFVRVVKQTQNDPVFRKIQPNARMYEDHCDEIKRLPNEFQILCTGEQCKIQAIKHRDKPMYGVQFHPERYSQVYRDGRQLLINFLKPSFDSEDNK